MKRTFKFALQRSLPVLFGFLPLGLAYGILMREAGYNVLWVAACSGVVFTGALQFLMVSFFQGGFAMATIILLSLSLNSRHIFYGLSFIERFRKYGFLKWILIFTLSDESYSLHCSYKEEEGVHERSAHVITGMLVWAYWMIFSILGNLLGSLIWFDTTGLDFALTALFVTILLDQIRTVKIPYAMFLALVAGGFSLLAFGRDNFILPALVLCVAGLFLLRGKIQEQERKGEEVSA